MRHVLIKNIDLFPMVPSPAELRTPAQFPGWPPIPLRGLNRLRWAQLGGVGRRLCAEPSEPDQSIDPSHRHPLDRGVTAAVRAVGLRCPIVAVAGGNVRHRLGVAIRWSCLRRQAAGILQGLALSVRRPALVGYQDDGEGVSAQTATVAQLIELAPGDKDASATWQAIAELQKRATPGILAAAAALCQSPDPMRRERGARGSSRNWAMGPH